MDKKISIVDVANALNISKTTVSFVLNGRGKEKRISDALSNKVMAFIEEVGFKPNPIAKGLRTGKVNNISLVMDNIANPFFADVAKAIEERAYEQGFCVIYSTMKNLVGSKKLIEALRDNHADACIIAAPINVKGEVITALVKDKFPIIMFDHYLNGIDCNYVGIDNKSSAFNATRHLIDMGYKSVALITFANAETQIQDRIDGYNSALKEKKLKSHIKKVIATQNENQIMESLMKFFEKFDMINAVLFGSANLCKIGLKVIKRLGLAIPYDIAIITFDDCEFFEYYNPPITAIAQPVASIADNIFNLLLPVPKYIKNTITQKITLPAHLNIRESSKSLIIPVHRNI